MLEQQRLELGRRDLEALDLDELLEAVDEVEPPVLVRVADVAGVQPAVRVEGVGRRLLVAEVAAHPVRPAAPPPPALPGPEALARRAVADAARRARDGRADRSG